MSQQINLFNPIFLKQKKHFSARTMVQGLALIFIGAVLVAVSARLQLQAMEEQAVETTRQVAVTKAQLATVSAEYAPRQKSKALEEELRRAEAQIKAQRDAFDIVQHGGFGDDKGYADYLRALARQIVSGLWLTGFHIAGPQGDIEIRGRALQPELIPAYISRLKQEPVMQGKTFSNLVVATPGAKDGKQDAAAAAETLPPDTGEKRFVEFILRSSDAGESSEEGEKKMPTLPFSLPGGLGR